MSRSLPAACCLCAVLACTAPDAFGRLQDATQPAEAEPAAGEQKDLPKAADLIEQGVQAMGGRECFEAIESCKAKAVMNSPMGSMSMVLYSAKGGRYYIQREVPGMGQLDYGCDGTVAWGNNPMQGGYQLLGPDQSKEMADQAAVYAMLLQLVERYPHATTMARQEFGGADCYKVKMTDDEGDEQMTFFDAETRLLAGIEKTQETPMGPMSIVVRFEDWKPLGDLTMYRRMTVDQRGMQMDMAFEELELNSVDPSIFELPEEVRTLAAEQAAAQPATQPDGG